MSFVGADSFLKELHQQRLRLRRGSVGLVPLRLNSLRHSARPNQHKDKQRLALSVRHQVILSHAFLALKHLTGAPKPATSIFGQPAAQQAPTNIFGGMGQQQQQQQQQDANKPAATGFGGFGGNAFGGAQQQQQQPTQATGTSRLLFARRSGF